MATVDYMIYEAIQADTALMELIGGRVVSTCFEIPPDEKDNTELPNIIITDDGMQNNLTTKDCVWEGAQDQVQVSVEIAGVDPDQVHTIMRKVRKAIEVYMAALGDKIPELASLQATPLQWDWMKPCYYKSLIYNCNVSADIDE